MQSVYSEMKRWPSSIYGIDQDRSQLSNHLAATKTAD